jgi:hypothetical protein
MGILKAEYHRNMGIETQFKHKAILAILSESYEAPMITLLQGLQELDFTVYVIGKPNINSWFVNEVIDDPRKVKFDFVLSGLHWGTRFDYYKKMKGNFKVLLDACDNRGAGTWKRKYKDYCSRYDAWTPPPEIAKKRLQPYRWMSKLFGYEPDLVFTSQKVPGDRETRYFPFGIQREYLKMHEGKTGAGRGISFAHIHGPGAARQRLARFMVGNKLPGHTFNGKARGAALVPKEIENLVKADPNVHSYHRWKMHRDYFRMLNDTNVLIYPGVSEKTAWWDSKRPWEAYASGALVLCQTPSVDMSEYPMTELCKEAVYGSLNSLVAKCKDLWYNRGRLEQLRIEAVEGAIQYFTPVPLARYFLAKVWGAM